MRDSSYFDFPLKSSNFKVWIDSGLPKTSTKLFVDFNNSLKNFNSETKLIYEDKNDEMVLDSLNLMYVHYQGQFIKITLFALR